MKLFTCFLVAILSVDLVLGSPLLSTLNQQEKLHKLSLANGDFGFKLMQSLEEAEHVKAAQSRQNVFVSPFSVSTVLAMMLAGGAHETYNQIYNTLGFASSHFSNDDLFQSYHQVFNDLIHNPLGKENVLSIANSIAVQKNYPLLQSFMGNITNYFNSHVFVEDFAHQGHKATPEINNWVNEQTHGKIQKLFDQDLDGRTIMVLLNAIYFKGTWKTKFAKEKTNKGLFIMNDHREEVQIMNVKDQFNYGQFDDGQMIELPYQNETLSMYIFLPPLSSQKSISATFSSEKLEQKITHLRHSTVNVLVPKFKFEATYMLTKTLEQMGIKDAFSPSKADFSNMDGRTEHRILYLSDVIHKTYIEVNEEGSEAAAVTGAHVRGNRPMPPTPEPEFRADHPFMFFIRDKQHGVTLFSGIINKP